MTPDTPDTKSHRDIEILRRRLGATSNTELERQGARFYRKMTRTAKRFDKRVSPLTEDGADHLLEEIALMASANAHTPGFHPGLAAMSPFLKTLNCDGVKLRTPHPAQRSYYCHEDFSSVAHTLMSQITPRDVPQGVFEDFRPFDSDALVVEDEIPLDEEDRLNFRNAGGAICQEIAEAGAIPLHYKLIATRIVTGANKAHVLTLLRPCSPASLSILAGAMTALLMPPEEPFMTCIAHVLTLDFDKMSTDQPNAVSRGFVAWEFDRIHETQIGLSEHGIDRRMWTEEEIEKLSTIQQDISAFDKIALQSLMLPAYFDLKLPDTVTGDRAEKAYSDTRPEEDRAAPPSRSTARRPFRMVRAVLPSARPTTRDAVSRHFGTRSEPETQVEVSGFWRTLRPATIGKDPQGHPVLGKTWVKSHRRWTDKPDPITKPRVKQPLAPYLDAQAS